MKRIIPFIFAVLAIVAFVSGCGSGNTPSSGNTELEGTWTTIVPGAEIMSDMTITFTFNGNDWELTELETETSTAVIQMSGTFTLDSKANPKTLNLYITDCPQGTEEVGTTLHSIYQLSGSKLTIANEEGGTRPTSFTAYNTIDLVKQ
jgi:uncharacterized protein (TIGR03067 family)